MTTAIILAAGKSSRMGAAVDKAFLSLVDKPVVAWSLLAFERCADIDAIVLVVRKEQLLASKAVWKFMRKIAEENNIPYQLEIFTGIGTDAGALHQGNDGVPTGVISIPSRYAHSSVEMIDMNDFENCEKLLEAFLLNMRDSSQFAFLADC